MRIQITLNVPKSKWTLGPKQLPGGFIHQSSAAGPTGKNVEHGKNKSHQTNARAGRPRLSKTTNRIGKVLLSGAPSFKTKTKHLQRVMEDQKTDLDLLIHRHWRARPQYRHIALRPELQKGPWQIVLIAHRMQRYSSREPCQPIAPP